jgi:hypothetical protein
MDYFSILTTGVVCAAFAFVGVLLGARYIKTRIVSAATGEIEQFIVALPARIAENPKLVHDLMEPIMAEVFKGLGATKGGGVPKGLKIGGFTIPGEVISIVMERMLGGAQSAAGTAVKEGLGLP